MTSSREELRRKEEDCSYRYRKDCQRIEEEQDDTKRQQRFLQEVGEQTNASASSILRLLESYECLQNPKLKNVIRKNHERISFAHSDSQRIFEESQEKLIHKERKLIRERDDREYIYRDELRKIERGSKEGW